MRLKPIGPDVLAHFKYDPDSPSGLNARGSLLHNGYRQVVFNKQFYKAHRIVYALHYGDPGPALIDHKDGDKSNNRIENLRIADHAEQQRNRTKQSNNKSGVKGLHYSARRNSWIGQVRANDKLLHAESKHRHVIEAWLIKTRASLHSDFARN